MVRLFRGIQVHPDVGYHAFGGNGNHLERGFLAVAVGVGAIPFLQLVGIIRNIRLVGQKIGAVQSFFSRFEGQVVGNEERHRDDCSRFWCHRARIQRSGAAEELLTAKALPALWRGELSDRARLLPAEADRDAGGRGDLDQALAVQDVPPSS